MEIWCESQSAAKAAATWLQESCRAGYQSQHSRPARCLPLGSGCVACGCIAVEPVTLADKQSRTVHLLTTPTSMLRPSATSVAATSGP